MNKSRCAIEARESFDSAVEKLLLKKTSKQRKDYESLYYFTLNLLTKDGTFSKCTAGLIIDELLQEAYMRCIQSIEKKGECIDNPYVFIRGFVKNIVKEAKRDYFKKGVTYYDQLQLDNLADEKGNVLAFEDFSEPLVQKLSFELQSLTPEDRNIICWWKVDGCSWKVIAKRLLPEGEPVSVTALRQRGSRLWKKFVERVKEGHSEG